MPFSKTHKKNAFFFKKNAKKTRDSLSLAADDEELVGGADFAGDLEGDGRALGDDVDGLEVHTQLVGGDIDGACGGACDEELVAQAEGGGLDEELRYAQPAVVLHAVPGIDFALGSVGAVVGVPLAQALPQVVAVPEPSVEDGSEPLVPSVLLRIGEGALDDAADGLLVTLHNGAHILRSSRASLYFKHAHACEHHFVDEADGLEVLGRHDVLVVNLQLNLALLVVEDVGGGVVRDEFAPAVGTAEDVEAPAAHLHAGASVGAVAQLVEAEVALAAHGHAEGAVAEHLDAHEVALRASNLLALDDVVDMANLGEVEFTGQHHHVGKAGVEAEGLGVADVELRAEVHFLPDGVAVAHHSYVAGNDCRDARLAGSIDDLAHKRHVVVIEYGVDGEVALDAVCSGSGGYLAEVSEGEGAGRAGTHVQMAYAEVDAVGTSLNSSRQRLARAYGGHDFKVTNVEVHGAKIGRKMKNEK